MEGITTPKGFKAAGVRCGLKSRGKDLAMIVSDYPLLRGVFTTNSFKQLRSCIRERWFLRGECVHCGQ